MPWDQLLDEADRWTVPSVGGVTVAALAWPGDDDLVVLAHATGFHKELWLPTVAELRAAGVTATVAAVDLRGHGQSSEPPGGLDWWDFGRDVLAIIDAAAPAGRVVGVGHSMGGGAVVGAAVHRPGTFAAIVLVDPAIMPPRQPEDDGGTADNPWASGARRRRPRFGSRAEALANFASKAVFATWPPEVLELYVTHGMADDGDGVALRCRPEVEADVFSRPEMVQLWDHLPSLGTDVTLITAGASQTHDLEHAAATAAQARAAHIRLAGVSHFIPMEAPADVAAAVARHLP